MAAKTRSPAIPSTVNIEHLRENVSSAAQRLSDEELARVRALGDRFGAAELGV
jgi:diketogulonate reductase-like aldo/keto reductase